MDTTFNRSFYIFELPDHGDRRTRLDMPVPDDQMIDLFSTRLGCVSAPRPLPISTLNFRWARSGKPGVKDRLEFYSAMERMTTMGNLLPNALLKVLEITPNIRLQHAIACVYADIQYRGKTVTEAFSAQADVFPASEIGQISAGEATGDLGPTFISISSHLEMMSKVLSQITLSLLYPVGLCVALYFILSAIFYFLVPPLAVAFKEMALDLPLPTLIIIHVSGLVRTYPLVLALPPVLAFFLWCLRDRIVPVASSVLRLVPLVRGYYLRAQLAQSISALSTLIHGGVGLQQALRLVAATTKDRLLIRALEHACASVDCGATPLVAFAKIFGFFGKLAVHFRAAVEIGLESGDLATPLMRASKGYQHDFIRMSESVSKLTEPLITVIIGVVVGSIAVSLLYPILTMTSHIK